MAWHFPFRSRKTELQSCMNVTPILQSHSQTHSSTVNKIKLAISLVGDSVCGDAMQEITIGAARHVVGRLYDKGHSTLVSQVYPDGHVLLTWSCCMLFHTDNSRHAHLHFKQSEPAHMTHISYGILIWSPVNESATPIEPISR